MERTRTKEQRDKGTKGQRDKGTKGQRDKGTKGQRDKGTKGQRRKKMGGKPSLTDIPCEFGLSPHFFFFLFLL
jgi:hypothetical protein